MLPIASLPPLITLDPCLQAWLAEDIGRGDRTTQALFPPTWPPSPPTMVEAELILKQAGVVVGLPVAQRVFHLLSQQASLTPTVAEGEQCQPGTVIAQIQGPIAALLTGERLALNLVMRLSGVATLTRCYADRLVNSEAQLVDTRKTTPGLRVLEKYATQLGGAVNHRMGLDDAVMIKDNHIMAAGGIGAAITQVRNHIPFPLAIEVETETLAQVETVLAHDVDIIMLDNMPVEMMRQAVELIRQDSDDRSQIGRHRIKIEASGNITLDTIQAVADTGVDYISTSAPITQAPWLDISLRFIGSAPTKANR